MGENSECNFIPLFVYSERTLISTASSNHLEDKCSIKLSIF